MPSSTTPDGPRAETEPVRLTPQGLTVEQGTVLDGSPGDSADEVREVATDRVPPFPSRVVSAARRRWRHTALRVRAGLAIALMGLVMASAVAATAYGLVRSSVLDERQSVAQGQAFTNARLLRSRLDPRPSDMTQLLAGLQVGGSGDSLLRIDDQWFSSSVQITPAELPTALSGAVESGDAALQKFEHFDKPALAVGVPINAVDATYYEISSLEEVEATLSRLSRSLLLAGIVATVLGGALGVAFSSAILQPLRRFALVAQEITTSGTKSRLDARGDSDLESIAEPFNEMLDELDERIERERRFASDVSHEIRGPVAALASAVSIVDRRRDQLPDEIVPVVDALDEQVTTFNRLVLDLLEISRFDARTATLETETVDLEELCRRIVRTRGHDGVTVNSEVSVTASAVVDRRRIEQAVANLLDNADRYAGGATDVVVSDLVDDASDESAGSATAGTISLRIRVEDRGPGVPPTEREEIFERFARGRAADAPAAPSGTGLGLALSRQHVELHGGRMWVEDRPGGGARFVIELPAQPEVP